ncbi:NAD(P)-binding domain-containing protein [Noviherbaspirillum sp.]|jgi:cation diffusion facilitator CzcD-associated flavoprotein CzcO|uniref:flavin-containing monooxygenase n=1 Tax=Noviherbaspirillum sp. TaxID=1926288 RepID=UPI0025CE25AC|nr:NAD(P)-binding domain-containing protein [Noviherbaspirillum sp.]
MKDYRKRFVIIGAGPVGLAMARGLRKHGIPYDQLEADDDIGGNWYHGVYSTAHIISSRRTTEFAEFPMPEHFPDFPGSAQIQEYLRQYATHFGLWSGIELNTKVVRVRPRSDELWSVSLANGEERIYKGVVVCNGHHWSKNYPAFAGRFAGEVLHAKDYKNPSQLAGKRVLVIGAGNSGCDIASEAARVAKTCDISLRRGYWFLPKTLFGKPFHEAFPLWLPLWLQRAILRLSLKIVVGDYESYGLPHPDHPLFQELPTLNSEFLHYLKHGRIETRPDIAAVDGRSVDFIDGTRDEYDLLVCATGYQFSFPFLPQGFVPVENGVAQLYGGSQLPGYKHIYIVGTMTPRYGFGPLLGIGADLLAQGIELQERMKLSLGTVLKEMGQKPPASPFIEPGVMLRQMKRAKWLVPLVVLPAERRLRKKLDAPPQFPEAEGAHIYLSEESEIY